MEVNLVGYIHRRGVALMYQTFSCSPHFAHIDRISVYIPSVLLANMYHGARILVNPLDEPTLGLLRTSDAMAMSFRSYSLFCSSIDDRGEVDGV